MQLQQRRRALNLQILRVFCSFGIWILSGCSVQSAQKNYALAEKLWSDGKYAAAVSEFEKVTAKDPVGKLGTWAQYRAAMTQAYFLSKYGDALRKFRRFSELTRDPAAKWEAQKQIGEILFAKTEQYDQVIPHYQSMILSKQEDPGVPEFIFRMGRSHFFLRQFAQAIEIYQDLAKRYPKTVWGERAAYEIGVAHYTQGGRFLTSAKDTGRESYQEAIDAFDKFIRAYPKSFWVPEAKFHIATSLEELDQLDAAYQAYQVLKTQYPSPKVLDIRMIRIKERQAQRTH